MNCYSTVGNLQTRLGVGDNVSYFLTLLDAASRVADQMSGRQFYVKTATKYFDGTMHPFILLPDCLSITTLKTDPIRDETYTDSWTEGTDFVLEPRDSFPKMRLRKKVGSDRGFTIHGGKAWIQIVGQWGAGNMRSASAWVSVSETGTVASTTGTTLALSNHDGLSPGHTILVGTEQMFITAVSGNNATVIRGVNGTTAAAHSAAAIYTAEYPAEVVRGTEAVACMMYRDMQRTGIQSEQIGNYSYSLSNPAHADTQVRRLFGMVRREPWV